MQRQNPSRATKPPTVASKDLVKVGPREVFANPAKTSKKDEVKPTTSRALVLRNGKYGAQGTGEIMLMSRISGREKLDLLAGDLLEKSKKAVAAPFDIQKCIEIAQSQYDFFLSDISNLHDSEFFHNLIEAEIHAFMRIEPGGPDPTKNPSRIAKIITTRIHNTHMLASAWKIVNNTLQELVRWGMTNRNVRAILKNDMKMRTLYLLLIDMINHIVDLYQSRFSVLALNSPHYAKYFKEKACDGPRDEPEIVFQHEELRNATLSFIDSIIIELCFPKAPYPKFILYQILRYATKESPSDTKRFSQLMWDAVGDLSECVELQQFLEAPLLTPEAQAWKDTPRKMSPEYEHWVNAQYLSLKASEEIANFKDLIFPLSSTARKGIVDIMWSRINSNYCKVSGQDVEDLWQLRGVLDRSPRWTSFYIPGIPERLNESDAEEDASRLAVARPKPTQPKPKKPLAITNYSDQSDSMPGLQTVSNSDDFDEEGDDSDESFFNSDIEDEDGYNTDEEHEIRELHRAAMDYAHGAAWFSTSGAPPETKVAEECRDNPFLNLLGSLRGRLFSPNPKLKVPDVAARARAQPFTASQGKPKAATSGQKVVIEEISDEEAPSTVTKKKKKKPKKKKKGSKAAETGENQQALPSTPSTSAPTAVTPPSASSPQTATGDTTSPASPRTKKKSAPLTPSKPKPTPPATSTVSIPNFETAASHVESARSYLSKLEPQKTKPKTRSDQPSIFSNNDEKNKFESGGIKEETQQRKTNLRSWFVNLSAKSLAPLHHLLGTKEDSKKGRGGMRWDDFVRVMCDMGFEYNPSTAGSSVKFTPPGKGDRAINFHKPHPKSYIEQWMLRAFAKRLKNAYGWSEDDLLNRSKAYQRDEESDEEF